MSITARTEHRTLASIGYHDPAEILQDLELDAAIESIHSLAKLVLAHPNACLEIHGLGSIRSAADCEHRLRSMQRDQVLAIAEIIPQ